MRLAAVTKDVSEQLAEVAERYQVPERLRAASDVARRGAQTAYDGAYRGAQRAYELARANPRTSTAAGVILAAALVGGVLWYIFGRETEQEERKTRRVRAGTGRKRAKTTRAARASA